MESLDQEGNLPKYGRMRKREEETPSRPKLLYSTTIAGAPVEARNRATDESPKPTEGMIGKATAEEAQAGGVTGSSTAGGQPTVGTFNN
ncbi:hypothetical protein K2173_008850 [Erythroxylum novogranatense]|uniref:Uncharacterized protein n=1 Tax=Erythroxylum novogranatense TaxID=1862640 RepID=A0AAV8UCG7_9ROSI|nr:hypothetical protein K2173_008850 [Erythroxylum novogranatense]